MPDAPEYSLENLVLNEEKRLAEFPVATERIFMGHAAVTSLPRRVAEAIQAYTEDWVSVDVPLTRTSQR